MTTHSEYNILNDLVLTRVDGAYACSKFHGNIIKVIEPVSLYILRVEKPKFFQHVLQLKIKLKRHVA